MDQEKFVSVQKAFGLGEGEVQLRGWIKRKREISDTIFVLLRDSTNEIQCVIEKGKMSAEQWNSIKKAGIESSIELKGLLSEDKRAPNGFELKVQELSVVGLSESFPISKDLSEEFLLDVRHLWLRSTKMTAINKIRSTVLYAVRDYYRKIGWFETSPAIITPNACEGGTTLFEFSYFGEKKFLSQSAQMYQEVLIFSLENVWGLTPSFRAEKSKTARHLTEYWHLEGEAAWKKMEDMMKVIEGMVEFVCEAVARENKKELELLGRKPEELNAVRAPFARISYDEALAVLSSKYKKKMRWGSDLSIKEEKLLGQDERIPFFIYGYPTAIKAFYVKEVPEDPKKCFSFDLIAPEGFGEICTGGQREDVIENMVKKLKKDKIPLKNYEWYLDLRRYGSVPHSGFGLGIERLLKWICRQESIKDVIPFPRTINRSYP
ncbi:MAG: asparagine--tRNA ligase [Candidatus Diapherotrites archaeon]